MSDSTPSNKPKSRLKADGSHSQTLLRDLALINARNVQQLGPLQPGASVATPNRKPNLPRPTPHLNQDAVMTQTNDSSPDSVIPPLLAVARSGAKRPSPTSWQA
ncbi:hypothetical protein [Xanthomonas phaseoli]|uniref:hypothetical protein n=1 Tax=Xanthomonas phaseoli TaxID=1985254 RepID=UPI0009B6224E|nr:hypothetical protein [Xanthomonas phaseoli]